jgi:hypothetical protein
MALPATDTFTGTDYTALQTYSASWSISAGGFQIFTNSVFGTGGTDNLAYWNADAFNADQYSQAVASTNVGTGVYMGVAVRASASTNGYVFYFDSSTGYISSIVGGAETVLGSTITAPAEGVEVRLEVSGTTLEVFYNDVSQGTRTSSAHSSGSAGIYGYGTSASAHRVDAWEGGNLGAASIDISAAGSLTITGAADLSIPAITNGPALVSVRSNIRFN